MTTYQGRIRDIREKPSLDAYILLFMFVVLWISILALGTMNIWMKDEPQSGRVDLLTCTEFLADLEAAEAF